MIFSPFSPHNQVYNYYFILQRFQIGGFFFSIIIYLHRIASPSLRIYSRLIFTFDLHNRM